MNERLTTSPTSSKRARNLLVSSDEINSSARSTSTAITMSTSIVTRGWPRRETASPPMRAYATWLLSRNSTASASVICSGSFTAQSIQLVIAFHHATPQSALFIPMPAVETPPVSWRVRSRRPKDVEHVHVHGKSFVGRRRLQPFAVAGTRSIREIGPILLGSIDHISSVPRAAVLFRRLTYFRRFGRMSQCQLDSGQPFVAGRAVGAELFLGAKVVAVEQAAVLAEAAGSG